VLVLAVAVCLLDFFILWHKNLKIEGIRQVPSVLSLGDVNTVELALHNRTSFSLKITVIDELPFQLQKRDFEMRLTLTADQKKALIYTIQPFVRGEYAFGNTNIYVRTPILGLLERRIVLPTTGITPVFPSIIQMKKFELKAFSRISTFEGIKKQRRLGHSYEFEQIKNYVRGDDFRSINWRATGKRNTLMVNQYEDERAQQVYSIIDKSRSMKMPFGGLSLLDYAINTSLVVSNIALKRYDRAGLISFSDKLGTAIKADRRANQLNLILNSLYNEKERTTEASFEVLYQAVRTLISGRSLIMLYTNFESMYALERALPLLRKINTQHLLVVVFFENTEVAAFANEHAEDVQAIYQKTIAQKFKIERQQMVAQLRLYGIQSVLTAPEDLSMNTVDKYLELKSRGLI
jgi:uncharacterized protein (DUF58 family)